MMPRFDKVPDPSVPDPWIVDMQNAAALPWALMGGTKAMQAGVERWLPKNPNERQPDYDYRLKTARLRNYFRRTVQNTAGKLFSKPFQVEGGLPVMKEISYDVDRQGTDVQAFGRDLTVNALGGCGMSLFLVDRDRNNDGTAFADQQRKTAPYWVHVPVENLIALRSQMIDGAKVITQLRYYRTIERPVNEFETEYVQQIRLITPYEWAVYEKRVLPRSKREVWAVVDAGPNTLGIVTLVPVYFNRTGFFQSVNPLDDLADMNLEHFQIRSEQRRSLQINSFPMLVATNYDGDLKDIVAGPNEIIGIKAGDGKSADLKFIESGGTHLEAGRNEINDLVDQMRAFGAQFDKPGEVGTVESASGRQIDAQEATTQLQLWALSLKDSIEVGLYYTGLWLGNDGGMESVGKVNMSLDFTKILSDSQMQHVIEARQLGDISRPVFLEIYRQNGLLTEDFNSEKNDEDLENEQPDELIPPTKKPAPAGA
jgi:hypothetical protein